MHNSNINCENVVWVLDVIWVSNGNGSSLTCKIGGIVDSRNMHNEQMNVSSVLDIASIRKSYAIIVQKLIKSVMS